ncbi:MAG: hypothetical protein A2745_01820 [Candidatus Harrisonbacteria bacterium RIFCSPHIGHO2_01_FULL_44_13]|uniref:Metallo-beta-lactamase domain-containing protein n=1 Tax=Candidatus Harrisonbacteria bacterium RIFCSPLOWO2_01_FULL_44_18 TaxID=1798407 RepID=A0A1G1ZLM1_9BACT|nr:MAG: hypothetical protein A2745_01820 [Candidatus Harrisonbacteria bacterium RIFCSPHIGHO2_01_FULL_44_13]OGY65543.1 MAG: hypothetical protein A3A16_01620 [Candidatus Harrisonbacteria bacterium RIFCSPLOWO2_01_FULL_44_18]
MNKFFHKKFIYLVFLILLTADIFIWSAIFSGAPAENPEFYFLDVGQGDSELVVLPGNVKLLIDGGPDSKVLSSLSDILSPADRHIDLVILTHPQLDHFGGLIDVVRNYQIGAFVSNGRKSPIGAYKDLRESLIKNNIPYVALSESDRIKYKDYVFEILSPSQSNLLSRELNDTALVMLLKSSNLTALYTGDAGFNIENELMKKYDLNVDILKVGHHGSKYASSMEFLNKVSPKISAIGVGKNSYGHPTKETLSRLADIGSQIFRTDKDGTIKVAVESESIKVWNTRQ